MIVELPLYYCNPDKLISFIKAEFNHRLLEGRVLIESYTSQSNTNISILLKVNLSIEDKPSYVSESHRIIQQFSETCEYLTKRIHGKFTNIDGYVVAQQLVSSPIANDKLQKILFDLGVDRVSRCEQTVSMFGNSKLKWVSVGLLNLPNNLEKKLTLASLKHGLPEHFKNFEVIRSEQCKKF